jgi:DNA-binding winged helix-turn-helix (wHTH) protein
LAVGTSNAINPRAIAKRLARPEALLQRRAEVRETILRVGTLELDLIERTARRDKRWIDLLPREFRLLKYMMQHSDQLLARGTLLHDVWHCKFIPKTNRVDVHMSRLRHKVDGPNEMPMIHNVRGVGFILQADSWLRTSFQAFSQLCGQRCAVAPGAGFDERLAVGSKFPRARRRDIGGIVDGDIAKTARELKAPSLVYNVGWSSWDGGNRGGHFGKSCSQREARLRLVSFCDFWNDRLRREYVIAKGFLGQDEKDDDVVKKCLRYHARHDLWGGLYYLRTSIVHNRVIATSQVAKCKIIKWFKPDDPISLSPEHIGRSFCLCSPTGTSYSRSNSPGSICQSAFKFDSVLASHFYRF